MRVCLCEWMDVWVPDKRVIFKKIQSWGVFKLYFCRWFIFSTLSSNLPTHSIDSKKKKKKKQFLHI